MRARFVGRAEVVARLRARLRDWTRSAPVVVRGPAGIGKSRLVSEAVGADGAEATGEVVWWQPGAPSRPASPSGHRPAPGGRTPHHAAVALGDLLGGEDAEVPGVLVVDDAHRLDAGAAAAIGALVRARSSTVVLTVRSDEPLPDGAASLLAGADVLDLPPLTDAAVDELVDDVAGGPLDAESRRRLRDLAAGNPLFATELVHDVASRGLLVEQPDGVRRLEGELEAPAGLVPLLEQRFARLSADARRLLDHLALAQPLPLGQLHRISHREAYAELDRAELLTVAAGQVELSHPLIAELLEQQLGDDDRAARSTELLDRLDVAEFDDPVRVARWVRDAGADRPDLLLAGAEVAVDRLDHDVAARFARAVLASGPSVEAELVLARCTASRPGGAVEAERAYAELEEERTLPDERRAPVAFARASNLLFGLGRPEEALAATERSIRATERRTEVTDAVPWRTELHAIAAVAALLAGEVDRAVDAGEQLADATDDPRSRVTAEVAVTLARTLAGRTTGVAERLELARSMLGELPKVDHLALADEQLGLTTAYLEAYEGRVDAAAAHTAARRERALAGQDALLGTWSAMACHVEALRGDLDAAAEHGFQAIEQLASIDLLRTLPIARCQLAEVEALRGHLVAAETLLGEVSAAGFVADRVAVNVGRVEATIHAARGETERAVEVAIRAGELGVRSQHRVWAALAFHDAARFGGADRVVAASQQLAATTDAPLIALVAAATTARAERDGPALISVSDRLLLAGARLYAAEGYRVAATLVDDEGADDLRRRAAAVLGSWRRPWTVADLPAPPVPTSRERDVGHLAAAGATNRVIAERLQVTVSTVENQLTRLYRKLGARGRDDLALLVTAPADRPEPPPAG
ncbi:hypothetical protein FTX61_04160 [Nitriliruptoraceae bacterium ZYF776]|nr:hypothetical protein [Profundirhabdus halotolerans]